MLRVPLTQIVTNFGLGIVRNQNRETLETISQYAQDTYKNCLSKGGQEEFCQRLFGMLK